MTAPPVQRCACGKKAAREPSRPRGFGPEPVQRRAADAAERGFNEGHVHPAVLRPSSGGQPLPPAVRESMEAALGHDFADVRVHVGPEAESIGAAAFTRGTHVHFAPGMYQPYSRDGRALLGHELKHRQQQRAGRVARPGGPVPINDDPALEREADAAGARAAAGRGAGVETSGGRGEALALDAAPAAGAGGGTGPIQPVWVSSRNGKIEYQWERKEEEPPADGGNWLWIPNDQFADWKNAGKRTGSTKWTDRGSGKSYYSPDQGKTFYMDKAHTELAPGTLDPAKLLDRSRPDRTKKPIALWDNAPYSESKKRETSGDRMEHDHVLAGESHRIRWQKAKDGFKLNVPRNTAYLQAYKSAQGAYNDAPSIEIPGRGHPQGWWHQQHSATWGSRQKFPDTVRLANGAQHEFARPEMDAELPDPGFYRDVDTMLSRTYGQHPADLRQAGAYRKLYKINVSKGVLHPGSFAFDITGDAVLGEVTYTQVPGETQGPRTDLMLLRHTRSRLTAAGGSTPSTLSSAGAPSSPSSPGAAAFPGPFAPATKKHGMEHEDLSPAKKKKPSPPPQKPAASQKKKSSWK